MQFSGSFSCEHSDPFLAHRHDFKLGIFQLPDLVYTLENFSCTTYGDNEDDVQSIDDIEGTLVMENVETGWRYKLDLGNIDGFVIDPEKILLCLHTESGQHDIYEWIYRSSDFTGNFDPRKAAYEDRDRD